MENPRIELAKSVLKEYGFFVDNLWHVDDVKLRWDCTDDIAQDILNRALNNETTMEQVFFEMDTIAEDEGLKPTDPE